MERITLEQARKSISEMNLINGFLFDSTLEDEDDATLMIQRAESAYCLNIVKSSRKC